ncbi:hypothetical protein K491DRAFT_689390 [Lophiostoma macrostomum CBS 122681]|uniref:Uncharacterized protein n=1 Tax=Lophiostoma macrostomum CBS 122681 TaxID=1314788 RepID=A0A6A6TGZ6_9PLEO|nr:hypothetical protein K491DRAFT_689390 [Lophiostoma macrostomum CBS 122681]
MARWGDMIDRDDSVDRLILELDYNSALPRDSDRKDKATQELYEGMHELITKFTRSRQLLDAIPATLNERWLFRIRLFRVPENCRYCAGGA